MRSGAAVDLISSRCLTCRLMTFVCTQLQTSTLKFRPLWERTLTFAIGKTVMVAVWLIRKASIVAVRWWLGGVELRWRVVWSFFDMCYTMQLKNIAGYRDWQTNSWSSSEMCRVEMCRVYPVAIIEAGWHHRLCILDILDSSVVNYAVLRNVFMQY